MNPRVLILTPLFHPIIGGVESNAKRLARYLHVHGTAVRVLTKRIDPTLPDVDQLDQVPICRIGPLGDRSGRGKWAMSPAVFRWLVRHRSEYDVVCVIDYRGVGVPAIAARALTGRPVVVQAQTPGIWPDEEAPDPLVTRAFKWAPRAMYRRADAIACISHLLEREALAYGIPANRIYWLPNAVDMARFRPPTPEERARQRAALGLTSETVGCLFVGRLSREKGILDLIEAWACLRPPQAVLLVAGPDMPGNRWDAGPAARAATEHHGLSGSIRFLGAADDVRGLLQAVDVAIQPSHFEALGLSAIEALACGVPVVASAVGGLLDFIADGVNGRLAPPRNPPALADALRVLIVNSPLRARLAATARDSVSQYEEGAVFGRMTDLLTAVVAARAR